VTRAGVAVAVAAAMLAAGCSSSGSPKQDDPVISPPASSVAGSTPAAAPSTAIVATSASAAPTTSIPAPSPVADSSSVTAPPIVQHSTCSKLTIRAIPGGASMGQEIAALQFTNDGTTSCELFGYPSVTLLQGGRPLGRPSQPSTTATSSRTLAPGATAESLLHDYVTNCQAPLSETLRVVAPGSTQTFARPMQLRACVLRVDQLGAPD